MDNVVAAVRCRPVTDCEVVAGHKSAVDILPSSKQVIVSKERAFSFNHVYGDTITQDHIYDELVNPVVEKAMQGFNACVMAYGQTGSGKTFTMGTYSKASNLGIVQLALKRIFCNPTDLVIKVSFLEVYKEKVWDLLSTEKRQMQIIDFKPVGLTLTDVSSLEEALAIMEEGLGNRRVGSTNSNLHSSRSHAIFTIHFRRDTEESVCFSKLYLVDLAGSESVSDVSVGIREEGVHINKGLLQLGNVMKALSSTSHEHIPYRNSALTAILRDTLSPQNFIVLIACISPLSVNAQVTISSLSFASRVGKIKTNPETGLLIKSRTPITTPFKIPLNYRRRINSTIATPGSQRKVLKRSALRPLNRTFDSPRMLQTPTKKAQCWPTSTPFEGTTKSLFISDSPIDHEEKRRSSSTWNPLNISSSTVVECITPQIEVQAPANLAQNPENEAWLRSIIADEMTKQLLSFTQGQLGPGANSSPPENTRRSARFSKARAIDSYSGKNLDPDQPCEPVNLTKLHVLPVRRSTRLSLKRSSIVQNTFDYSQCNTTIISNTNGSVRRSSRLSVAQKTPVVSVSSPISVSAKRPKISRKVSRLSARLSILPHVTPENSRKEFNNLVLHILKSGDTKKLQTLPTIGPKTAIIISNHRLLNGPIKSFKDLHKVRGLSSNFMKKFLWANNIEDFDDALGEEL